MTKNNKSTAMIRRRKNKPTAEFLSRVRKMQLPKAAAPGSQNENEEAFFHKQVLGSSGIAKIMSSDKTLFLGLVAIRLVNALLIQTSFVPDEFWQSMEVAHNMVFHYGYLTWEWRVGIRSYAYPLLLATLYKLLYMLGLDYRVLLIRGPRLLQGVIASVGDMYLYRLSRRLAGREVAQWTLLCQLLSWFTAYCCTRTLTNSMETTLVIAALYYFPWPGYAQSKGDSQRFVLLAATSVVVRPTAGVLWALMAAWHLQLCKGTALWSVLRLYLTSGLTVLGVSTVIDRVWYGRWVLVHLNFVHFNVVSGGSGFYGRHPWHWYLTQGLPVTLGPHLLPFLLGAWHAGHKVLLLLLLWQVFVLSLLAHKEFRFLLPVLPLAMHYCGLYFHSISQPSSTPSSSRAQMGKKEEGGHGREGVGGECDPGITDQLAEEETCGVREVVKGDRCKTTDDFDVDRCNLKGNAGSDLCNGTGDISGDPYRLSDIGGDSSSVEESGNADSLTVDSSLSKAEGEEFSSPTEEGAVQHPTSLVRREDQGSERQPFPAGSCVQNSGEWRGKGGQQDGAQRACKVCCLVMLLAVSSLLPLFYFSLIHQRGTIDVMNFLHHQAAQQTGGRPVDILFLMPCHSTPFYSHLHTNVSLTFLTCEPNLHRLHNYTDMADLFYQDPECWLKEQYGDRPGQLPTHVVYFNSLKASISRFLQQGGYTQCAQFFHTHLPQGRVGSQVLVSCR